VARRLAADRVDATIRAAFAGPLHEFVIDIQIREIDGFRPPASGRLPTGSKHTWDATDYMGASLQLLVDLLGTFDYSLICCNAATGANAFFVKNDFMHLFKEVPKDINDIFVGSRYDTFKGFGHPNSPKTIERMLKSNFDLEHIFRKTTDSI
jgi:hypothetical protein